MSFSDALLRACSATDVRCHLPFPYDRSEQARRNPSEIDISLMSIWSCDWAIDLNWGQSRFGGSIDSDPIHPGAGGKRLCESIRQAHCVSCEGALHTVPSPLVGEGQGEGWR